MKYKFFLLLFIFSLSIAAQKNWSLQECIDHAKENNFDIRNQLLQNEIIQEDVSIAIGNYLPKVSFLGTQGYNLGNTFNVSTGVGQLESKFNYFSLSSSINLFNSFNNRYQLEKSKLKEKKANADLSKLRMDLSLNVASKYLQVLFDKEILSVAIQQMNISEQEVDRLNKLFKSGLKPKTDLLEMQSTFANDKKEVLTSENNLSRNLIKLQELLDIQTIDEFDIEEINIDEFEKSISFLNVNSIYESALKVNPSINSILLTAEINKQDIKISKASQYPRIDFDYSYSTSYYNILGTEDLVFNQESNEFEDNGFLIQLDNNRTHYLGFTLSVPIFDRFLKQSNIDKSSIELEITKIKLNNQMKELKNEIYTAFNDVRTAKGTLEASELSLIFQKEAFSIAQNKYKDAFITSYEFLESKSNYIRAQSELIKAKYDYIFKVKILEYYQNIN